jgi:hypothetical protein
MSSDATVAPRAAAPQAPSPARVPRRGLVVAILAALLAVGSLAAAPAPVAAAGIKVAIIVGPSGGNTSTYLSHARSYASLARSYGAKVVEVYTPNATWSRAKAAAQGANLLIYLGHGNGFPNPYHSTLDPKKVDGLGLNPYAGSGNTTTRYYGEYYVKAGITLAPNAVVLLNHLCYSAGSSEPGRANPSLSTAKKRVDNYGAGFLRVGAKTVFAETLGNASYVIRSLFTTNRTMSQIFWAAPNKTGTYKVSFTSSRTSGMSALMDPRKPGQFYRSVVGKLSMTASTWRP